MTLNSTGNKERASFSKSGDLESSLDLPLCILPSMQNTLHAMPATFGAIHRIKEFPWIQNYRPTALKPPVLMYVLMADITNRSSHFFPLSQMWH